MKDKKSRSDMRYLCKSKIVAMSYKKCVRGYIDLGNFENGILSYVQDAGSYYHIKIFKSSIVAVGMADAAMANRVATIIIDEINHMNRMIECISEHHDELRHAYESNTVPVELSEEMDFIKHSLCYADTHEDAITIIDALCALNPISDYYVSITNTKSSMANCRYTIGYDMQSPLAPEQYEKLVTGAIIAEMDPHYITHITISDAHWVAGTKPYFTVIQDGHISSKISIFIPIAVKNRSGGDKSVRITINSTGAVDHTSPCEEVRTLSYNFMHELLYYINHLQ